MTSMHRVYFHHRNNNTISLKGSLRSPSPYLLSLIAARPVADRLGLEIEVAAQSARPVLWPRRVGVEVRVVLLLPLPLLLLKIFEPLDFHAPVPAPVLPERDDGVGFTVLLHDAVDPPELRSPFLDLLGTAVSAATNERL